MAQNITGIKASMRASMNQATRYSKTLNTLMEAQKLEFSPQRMAQIRGYAEKTIKAVHEVSAYSNVLFTDNK